MKWKKMQWLKRFSATALAATLTVTGLPTSTMQVKAAGEEVITNGAFDADSASWASYDGGIVDYVSDFGNTNNGALKLSGRKEANTSSAGVCTDITGKVAAGETYQIKASVYYQSGEGTDNPVTYDETKFNICIFFGSSWVNSDSIQVMASTMVEKNSWGTIEGAFDIPSNVDLSKVRIFVETVGWKASYTEEDLITYYLDDVSMVRTKDATPVDTSKQMKVLSGTTRTEGNNNPLIDSKFGADPYGMEYNGRVYIYMTNDSQQYDVAPKDESGYPTVTNGYGSINTISVLSSADMVNWTDHGDIPVAGSNGIATWANNSWAPAACHKTIDGKEKFFLYFADGGGGIGVLEADSPIGPFREPETGSRLIQWGTQASEGVAWLFDPAVLVDDDGTGYLYYGGGVPEGKENMPETSRVVKLKDNMTELDGDAVVIEAPAVFEDSGIHKYNGTYYYTYCSNWNNTTETGIANICVMTSDNPMGPFTYQGIAFENQNKFFGIGGNNHHCFFDFNGKHYFTYHAQTLTKALGIPSSGQGYRSTHIEEVSYNEDGSIQPIIGTYKGASQTQNLDPYTRVEAETTGWASGTKTEECTEPGSMVESVNMKVTEITDGDYISVSQADFGTDGAETFTVKAAGLAGGKIEIHLDSAEGTKIGEIQIPAGDSENVSWNEYTCNVAGATDVHNVYLVFVGAEGSEEDSKLMEVDCWSFAKKASEGENTDDKAALDQAAADAVKALIASIGTVTNSADSKSKIEAARAAYDKLTPEQKALITNADVLTKAETAYNELANKPADTTNPPSGDSSIENEPKEGATYTVGSYSYKVTSLANKTVSVVKTTKQSTTISIGSTVKIEGVSFKITEIAKNAFKGNKKVTTVKGGKNLKTIGANAFSGCTKLAKVTIDSKELSKIDTKAFYNCKKLKAVKLSSSKIKTVGKRAFKGIEKKAKIDVPNKKAASYKKLFQKQGLAKTAVVK